MNYSVMPNRGADLYERLRRRVVGQEEAIRAILPYVEIHESGLSPEGRPAGVFLLLGPTGTGKTRTVEALAEVLHGSDRNVLRIECGEFQLEHEVAKLIGAPPGYLGHRETQPLISQQRLNAVASNASSLSLVLLDEIEKAAPSMGRLLLGVLDKGVLRLGDNTSVNFERSLIFMTSNLGAREMMREMGAPVGFASALQDTLKQSKLRAIALHAVRRRFSPEFINRIDQTVTYGPLSRESLELILGLQLESFERHVSARLGRGAFTLCLTAEARAFLLDEGTSREFGARELKRAIHRHLIQRVAQMVVAREIPHCGIVHVGLRASPCRLSFRLEYGYPRAA